MEQYHRNKKFEKIIYSNQLVEEREFHNCQFVDCNFSGNQFLDCYFENCSFLRCDLSLLKVTDSSFLNVKMKDCKAIGILWDDSANPFSVYFEACILNYSSFYGKNLKYGVFKNCMVQEVIFSETNLIKANFQRADLKDSIFDNTNLTQANFEGAINYTIDLNLNKTKGAIFQLPEAMALLNSFDIVLK